MEGIKRSFLFALFLIGLCATVQAQTLQVSGTVVSKADGFPVIGASVIEIGNEKNGIITDLDGKFSLTVKQGAEISVSYIGCKTQTLKAQSVMNIIWKKTLKCLMKWL